MIGENPWTALTIMVKGAFLYPGSLGYTLFYTTNFIFTGLAVATAFKAKLFNIGGEGQAYVGSLGVLLAASIFAPYLPMILVVLFCIIGSALAGAAWALIPGYLQAKRDSHVVITTIMFNFLAGSLMVWLLGGPLKQPNQQSPQTSPLPETAQLPKLDNLFSWIGIDVSNTPLNWSFIVALVMLFAFWVLIWKTRLGYEIRTVGENQDAARYAGISVPRIIIITMMISGAFAGLLAVNSVMGFQHRVVLNYSAGYGFTGIAVALMGRNHPVGIFFASLLFGALFQGGAELDFEFQSITREMVLLIQGMIILFSGALAYMFAPTLSRILSALNKGDTSDG
jgi:simple sugar transport system permease protein